jgi:ribosomal-protein-alanine N-acetyltransferase
MPAMPSLRERVETPRLILRSAAAGDAKTIHDALVANEAHLAPWSPLRMGKAPPLAEMAFRIQDERRAWRVGEKVTLWAFDRATGAVRGRAALSSIVRGAFQNAYLGYWVDGASVGKGLATEMVRGAVAFAFERVKLHRVQAAVMPRNAASLRVVEKCGFRREGLALRYLEIAGVWEDHVIHAKTAEEG